VKFRDRMSKRVRRVHKREHVCEREFQKVRMFGGKKERE